MEISLDLKKKVVKNKRKNFQVKVRNFLVLLHDFNQLYLALQSNTLGVAMSTDFDDGLSTIILRIIQFKQRHGRNELGHNIH